MLAIIMIAPNSMLEESRKTSAERISSVPSPPTNTGLNQSIAELAAVGGVTETVSRPVHLF
jgi:hypothetical protein